MEDIVLILEQAESLSDACRKLNIPINGSGMRKIKNLYSTYGIVYTKGKGGGRTKYEKITKDCPVCGEYFITRKDHPREKQVCSRGCSNTYFRSGKDNPNYKGTCNIKELKKIGKCQRCWYSKHPEILCVHHKDRDRSNNIFDNLELLCPNCHALDHYQSKDGMYHWLS